MNTVPFQPDAIDAIWFESFNEKLHFHFCPFSIIPKAHHGEKDKKERFRFEAIIYLREVSMKFQCKTYL